MRLSLFWYGFFLLHSIPAANTCCYSLFLAMFVISFGLTFLSFTRFLLLTLAAIPCFLLLHLFIIGLTSILLYKRIYAFVGQILFTGSKGSWTQFVLICQSHSVEDLYSIAGHFPLHFSFSPDVILGFYFFFFVFRPFLLFSLFGGPLGLAFLLEFWIKCQP